MVYEVICSSCGVHYRVTTQGGETKRVACPSCGHRMTVAFPVAERKRKKHSETHKALWTMLIVLLIGLPAGGYGWLKWQEHQAAERAAFEQKRAERKAHVDSLNAIRAQQDAEELEAIRQKAQDERVERFITRFYDDTLFGNTAPDNYRESLTERCYQHLLADGDATTDSLAWQRLQPSIPGSDRTELFDNFRVQPQGDSWYNVVFSSKGMTQTRQLKVVEWQGHLLIDDYR